MRESKDYKYISKFNNARHPSSFNSHFTRTNIGNSQLTKPFTTPLYFCSITIDDVVFVVDCGKTKEKVGLGGRIYIIYMHIYMYKYYRVTG